MIRFTVPMEPVAQPKHGAHAVRMPDGTYKAIAHPPPQSHPVHQFRAAIAIAAAAELRGAPPIQGPVCLSLLVVLRRPKAMCWKTRPKPRERHAKMPDASNVTKAVEDALNGVVWRDDAQISDLIVRKRIASGDEAPRLEVEIEELDRIPEDTAIFERSESGK